MKHISSVMIPAVFILLLFTGICGAQEMRRPGPSGNAPRDQEHEAQFREWIWNNLKTYLKLDDNTAARFQPIFKEYRAIRGKLMHEHNQLIKSINSDADNPAVPVKELRDHAQRLAEVNKSLIIEWEKYYQKAKGVLDERQQIKLLIFEDKVKEDIFRRMEKHSGSERPSQPGPPDR